MCTFKTTIVIINTAHVFASPLDSKAAYRLPSLYPSPATATAISQVTQNGSYPPTTTRGLIPLPLFNRTPAHTQFGTGTFNTSTTLYTLYPPHTSTQCSCSYCASSNIPTAFTSHALGTLPVLSGFNSSLTSDILKFEKEVSSSFTRVSEILPHTQPSSFSSTVNQPSNQDAVSSPSPQQGLKETQTPPESESVNVCKCSPSSIHSGTPIQHQNISPCPTLPTNSESASTASGYECGLRESATSASVADQALCSSNQTVYGSGHETKPLFHLPASNLELITSSSSGNPTSDSNHKWHPQWLWSAINSGSNQSLYQAELPELSESNGINGVDYMDPVKEGLDRTSVQPCVDQAHSP